MKFTEKCFVIKLMAIQTNKKIECLKTYRHTNFKNHADRQRRLQTARHAAKSEDRFRQRKVLTDTHVHRQSEFICCGQTAKNPPFMFYPQKPADMR